MKYVMHPFFFSGMLNGKQSSQPDRREEWGKENVKKGTGAPPFFKSVRALPDYRLEIHTQTNNVILFDFTSRLNTVRFGELRDQKLFESVSTDGYQLIFVQAGKMEARIDTATFIDLLLVDRTQLE